MQDRKRVEILRGILTDTMAQLKASNEYIAVIFNCYKDLVHHFRSYGFMKKYTKLPMSLNQQFEEHFTWFLEIN